jgi:hypothetical protein
MASPRKAKLSLRQLLVKVFAENNLDHPIGNRHDALACVRVLFERYHVTFKAMADYAGISEAAFTHWRRGTSARLDEERHVLTAFNEPFSAFSESEAGRAYFEACKVDRYLAEF